jgi:hypothetical protein
MIVGDKKRKALNDFALGAVRGDLDVAGAMSGFRNCLPRRAVTQSLNDERRGRSRGNRKICRPLGRQNSNPQSEKGAPKDTQNTTTARSCLKCTSVSAQSKAPHAAIL